MNITSHNKAAQEEISTVNIRHNKPRRPIETNPVGPHFSINVGLLYCAIMPPNIECLKKDYTPNADSRRQRTGEGSRLAKRLLTPLHLFDLAFKMLKGKVNLSPPVNAGLIWKVLFFNGDIAFPVCGVKYLNGLPGCIVILPSVVFVRGQFYYKHVCLIVISWISQRIFP